MQDTIFNVGDSVQLKHGYTPTMTVSKINHQEETAFCVWYDTQKTRKIIQDWIPLSALKLTPERTPINLEELFPKYKT